MGLILLTVIGPSRMDRMLIILAKREDAGAEWLADRWRNHDAVVVSPADFSEPGWTHYVGSHRPSRLHIGGSEVRQEDISGVLVRMASVSHEDLDHIVPSDRAYVAAEMTAFMLAWLSGLACPVLNRPTAQSLGGPAFPDERWVHFASGIGIPIVPVRRGSFKTNATAMNEPGCELTVVGNACFGDGDRTLMNRARRLAMMSGTDLLSVRFSGSKLVSASSWPDVCSPEFADAVLSCFMGRALC
jgi:hypothetical protein